MADTYINTTCKVGQSEPCGRPAAWVIAVTEVTDTAWDKTGRTGGVVALCEEHATKPVSAWDRPRCCLLDGHGGRCVTND